MDLTLEFIEELLAPPPEFVFVPKEVLDVTCPLCWRMGGYLCITRDGFFHQERIEYFERYNDNNS